MASTDQALASVREAEGKAFATLRHNLASLAPESVQVRAALGILDAALGILDFALKVDVQGTGRWCRRH